MYRVLVRKETRGSPSGRWETVLKLFLKYLMSYIQNIFYWLRDLDFVAEDRDKWRAVVNRAMNCPVHKVMGIY
jgi:hypothetical protein